MPVDTSMYAQQVQPANPLATMSQYAGLQGQMQQNQLLQRTMAAREATGEAVQGATDADGNYDPRAAMAAAAQDPRAAFGAAEFQGFNQEQQTNQQALQTAKLTQAITVRSTINQSLGALMSKPDSITPGAVTSQIGELVAGNILPAAEAAKQIADMPTDPQQLKSWVVNHWMQGQAMSTQLQAMMPAATQVDDGKHINFVRNPAIGATPGPIDKQTTPEFDASPVAGPVGPNGEPTTTTQGQRAGMGTIAVGQGPAANAAASVTGTGNAQQGLHLSQQAEEAKNVKAMLGNLSADLKSFSSGPGADKWKGFLSGLGRLGIQVDPNMVASQENFNKMSTMLAQRQFSQLGGTGTDRQLGSAIESNPNSALSSLGNSRIIAMLKGNADAIGLENQLWQKWQQAGHGAQTYNQFVTSFNKKFDPRAFQMQYLNPGERKQMVTGMNAAEQAQFKNNYNYAVKNGWIGQ